MTLNEAISEYNAVAAEGQDLLHEGMDPVEVAVITQLIGLASASLQLCIAQDSRLRGVSMALSAPLEDETPTVNQGATEALKDA